jgi:uncharacterized SAM-binding protein YcdF (DUF218 family)
MYYRWKGLEQTGEYTAAPDRVSVHRNGARIIRTIGILITRGAVLTLSILLLLYVTPLVPDVTRILTDRWDKPGGDVLIVLGADQLGDGTLGIASYWRTVYAVRAWRAGHCKRIVFSGGRLGYPGTQSLAAEMGQFAMGLDVPAPAISLEERSLSTRENALFTTELVQSWPGSKVLMTSDAHMLRSRLAFEHAGLQVRTTPIPDIGKRWNRWPARWECILAVATEVVKLGYYRIQGWV